MIRIIALLLTLLSFRLPLAAENGSAKDSLDLFGKNRFSGAPGDDKGERPRATAKKTAPPPPSAPGPGCVPTEVSAEEVKRTWRPPPGFCEAAVIQSHCIWENIERKWIVIKHEPTRYCRNAKHLGFTLDGNLERLGILSREAFVFFPEWMFENHSATDPVVILLPCERETRKKPEPSRPALRIMKAVKCGV